MTFTNGGMRIQLSNFRLGQQLLLLPTIGPFISSLKSKLPVEWANDFSYKQLQSIWGPNYPNQEEMDQDIKDIVALVRLNGGNDLVHKTITYINDRSGSTN